MRYEQNLKEKAAIIDQLWFEADAGEGFCQTMAAKVLEWMAEVTEDAYAAGYMDRGRRNRIGTILQANGLKPTTNDNN